MYVLKSIVSTLLKCHQDQQAYGDIDGLNIHMGKLPRSLSVQIKTISTQLVIRGL